MAPAGEDQCPHFRQNGNRIDRIGMWLVGWNEVVAISNPPRGFDEPQPNPSAGLPTESRPRIRSESETTTDCRSKVVVVVIGHAGAVRNGNGQTTAHPGICNSRKTVETLGEVIIHKERPLVESTRAGSAETGGRAGRRNAEIVLPLLIPGESDVGFAAVGVLHARPPDLHQLFRIKV